MTNPFDLPTYLVTSSIEVPTTLTQTADRAMVRYAQQTPVVSQQMMQHPPSALQFWMNGHGFDESSVTLASAAYAQQMQETGGAGNPGSATSVAPPVDPRLRAVLRDPVLAYRQGKLETITGTPEEAQQWPAARIERAWVTMFVPQHMSTAEASLLLAHVPVDAQHEQTYYRMSEGGDSIVIPASRFLPVQEEVQLIDWTLAMLDALAAFLSNVAPQPVPTPSPIDDGRNFFWIAHSKLDAELKGQGKSASFSNLYDAVTLSNLLGIYVAPSQLAAQDARTDMLARASAVVQSYKIEAQPHTCRTGSEVQEFLQTFSGDRLMLTYPRIHSSRLAEVHMVFRRDRAQQWCLCSPETGWQPVTMGLPRKLLDAINDSKRQGELRILGLTQGPDLEVAVVNMYQAFMPDMVGKTDDDPWVDEIDDDPWVGETDDDPWMDETDDDLSMDAAENDQRSDDADGRYRPTFTSPHGAKNLKLWIALENRMLEGKVNINYRNQILLVVERYMHWIGSHPQPTGADTQKTDDVATLLKDSASFDASVATYNSNATSTVTKIQRTCMLRYLKGGRPQPANPEPHNAELERFDELLKEFGPSLRNSGYYLAKKLTKLYAKEPNLGACLKKLRGNQSLDEFVDSLVTSLNIEEIAVNKDRTMLKRFIDCVLDDGSNPSDVMASFASKRKFTPGVLQQMRERREKQIARPRNTDFGTPVKRSDGRMTPDNTEFFKRFENALKEKALKDKNKSSATQAILRWADNFARHQTSTIEEMLKAQPASWEKIQDYLNDLYPGQQERYDVRMATLDLKARRGLAKPDNGYTNARSKLKILHDFTQGKLNSPDK